MNIPSTPSELRSVLLSMAKAGSFSVSDHEGQNVMPEEVVCQAVEETIRVIENAAFNGYTPTASERILGLLFTTAVERAVRNSQVPVTTEEA